MSFRGQLVHQFLADLAAKQPTPGGGAVAGLCGALSSALAQMVVSYSLGKKSLAQHQHMLEDAARRLERARSIFLELADEDAEAYALLNEISRLPDTDPRRARDLPGATQAAVSVPMSVAAAAVDALRLLRALCGASNPHLRSDLAIAAVLAEATARAARWNVVINLSTSVPGLEAERLRTQVESLTVDATRLCAEVERACL
ncbi:MAG: cyclodeaminase/cyclohydrolase family protein [Phycisphaerales bacterium]